jgi:putative oxidoreductase
MSLSSISDYFKRPETGLLLLRIGAGITMITHGLPIYFGSAHELTNVGSTMNLYGVSNNLLAWGFTVASIEVLGGIFVIMGLLTRLSSFAMVAVLVAEFASLHPKLAMNDLQNYEHAWLWLIICVFVALFFTGPGEYSVAGGSKGSKGASKGAAKGAKGGHGAE